MLWLSVAILGVTAGFCPINIMMVTPYMPSLLGSKGKVSSAILFSIGISVVFVPLGIAFGSFGGLVLHGWEYWLKLGGGMIMLVIGLWTLRLIRLPLSGVKVRKISGGIFVFGVAYALTTVGRGAPMLISALSLVALSRDFISGGLVMTIYSFCLGIPLVVFAVTMETLRPERREGVVRRSAMLEMVTGVLLLALGVYYIISALLPTH